MRIENITEKSRWDEWVVKHCPAFTQSWEWGEVLSREGHEVNRMSVYDDSGSVSAQAQVIFHKLPFGLKYAFCPKGPVFSKSADVGKVYDELEKFFLGKCIFARVEPEVFVGEKSFVKVADVNPGTTIELDLSPSESDLCAQMKKNTRYSIRFAGNQNLEIKEEINVDLLWDMLSCSAKRDGFSLHHKKHYESVLKYPDIYQLTALKKGKAIATAVFIGFGECVTYLYAGMDYNEHKMLAPYLLRWLAIKKSKLIGYKKMDFFGIAPAEIKDGKYIFDKNHQYAGITQFKLGFGGEIKTFPGTFDFVFHKNKYRIYNFIRAIRRLF